MEQDQRAHRRRTLRTEAAVADVLGNTWSKVDLLDISQSGLAFLSAEQFATGASRMLRFQLPGEEAQIHVLCRIAHCTPHNYLSGYRIGTAIVRIDEADALAVARFVAG